MIYTKPRLKSFCAAFLASAVALTTATAQRTLYVSVAGDASNDGLARARPVDNIQLASRLAQPGDTVLVMPGTYTKQSPGVAWDEVGLQRSGQPGKYITIRGERDGDGNRPVIVSTQLQAISAYQKSYLIIEGFELTIGEEDDQGLVEDFARAEYQRFFNRPAAEAWNGRVGIALNGAHHIIARDLYIHDFPGNGVQSGGADAILIEDVTVEHCGYGAPNANSGISFYQPKDAGAGDVDGYEGYGIVIRDCESRYNTNLRNFVDWGDGVTDGNGIIVDDFRRTQSSNPVNYPKRTLILGNATYGNGGPGINVYESDKVDIYHNSTYDNGQSASLANQAYRIVATPREMQLYGLADVNVVNNVIVTTDEERVFYSGTAAVQADLSFRNNLLYSTERPAAEVVVPDSNRFADPGYASARPLGRVEREKLARTSRPYDNANLQAQLREPTVTEGFPVQDLSLTAGSPAIDAGEDLGYVTVVGDAPDIGAFEFGAAVGVRESVPTHQLGARLRYDGTAIVIAEAPAGARVYVYDELGRTVYAATATADGTLAFDASALPAGAIAVELRHGGQRWVGRATIVR